MREIALLNTYQVQAMQMQKSETNEGKKKSFLACSYHQRSPLAPESPNIFVWDVLSRYNIGHTFLLFGMALPPVVDSVVNSPSGLVQALSTD